ncbi:hypothetical protein XENTR_v10005395 [Xenopus tropicalis]|nr:hypothetical protein XENTR_v10005395 [Xenopus tropicalis]
MVSVSSCIVRHRHVTPDNYFLKFSIFVPDHNAKKAGQVQLRLAGLARVLQNLMGSSLLQKQIYRVRTGIK